MDAASLLDAMARARRTLAVAESFTGGRVLDALTDLPGASRVLRGGIVAYGDEAKRDLLDVPHGLLLAHGAVSREVCLALARGVQTRLGADLGLATTGIAGPTGATPAKPVGLSVAAAVGPTHARVGEVIHPGARRDIKEAAQRQALGLLEAVLRAEGIL